MQRVLWNCFVRDTWRLMRLAGAGLAVLGWITSPALAQTGTLTGTIASAETGDPLASAQVSLEGTPRGETGLGGLTRATGRYLILNVPPGQYVVRAQLIGFGTRTQVVTVTEGRPTVADFALEPEAISLSEIVVTGVVGATQRTKLPFEVAQVRIADLPVPSVSAVQSIQGKVAGALVTQGSGLPGTTPSVLLRGVTALDANGRSQDPLYIIDGVILGTELVEMGGLDIQSVEVIKGAAAASLYGSRAANGVIQIRTRRGAEMPNDQVRYTVRSEYGGSGLARNPAIYNSDTHYYALTPDGDAFLDNLNEMNPCQWLECGEPALAGQGAEEGGTATKWNSFQSNPFPGRTYDQVARFFTGGNYLQNHVSVEGRSGRTNFLVSGSFLDQEGIVRYLPGFQRTNLRMNLDQNVLPNLTVRTSAFYSRSSQPDPGLEYTPLVRLRETPTNVDLLAPDPADSTDIAFIVGPGNQINPLYELKHRSYDQERSRFLGSADLRYTPGDWLAVDGNVSLDRFDQKRERFSPMGYKTITPNPIIEGGSLQIEQRKSEALNASLTATARWNPTDGIRNSTQLRYLIETLEQDRLWTDGYGFAVGDVPTFTNIDQETLWALSGRETIRADGAFLLTNFDVLDRYVVDALVRNDGSSLFGADERRQWYYRVGGAWRVSQESFFDIPTVDELKLRYSVGTAGGRPQFSAQYETFDVQAGRITPNRLGNKELKPEFSTEHEAGIDLSLLDYRAMLSLTYARTTTEDQILQVDLPSVTGYVSQWKNAGTIQSRSWEATLDLRLVQRPEFSWSTKLLFDATRSKITALNVPAFKYGDPNVGGLNVFFAREGEEIGAIYGTFAATSCAHLPWATLSEVGCSQFVVNDDGYLVWVGEGGSLDNPHWGTNGPTINGRATYWGAPFQGVCMEHDGFGQTEDCRLGSALPDYNISVSTTLSWKGFSAYALFTRSSGFDVVNYSLWKKVASGTSGFSDQGGVAQELQKPFAYYEELISHGSAFVEDGTFTKLREVSLTYQVGAGLLDQLPGLRKFTSVRLNLTGRNLFTWTDYRGLDPEVGMSGRDMGSAALTKIDRYAYPNFRTLTGSVEFVF